MGYSEHSNFASIAHSKSGQVLMHSSAAAATSPPVLLGFESNLKSNGNGTLWESLDYDGDGSWILEGMINRSLIIIHDGSYMKEVSPFISAAATMIYCTKAKKRCKCTWAEKSESAGSYRGERLGGIMSYFSGLLQEVTKKESHVAERTVITMAWSAMGILPTSL